MKYKPVASCPAFLTAGPIREGPEELYRLQTANGVEQVSVFQNRLRGIAQVSLPTTNARRNRATFPSLLPVGSFALNHTHPSNPAGQGPSLADSIAVANLVITGLIIAPDSLYWMNPRGKSYGCAR